MRFSCVIFSAFFVISVMSRNINLPCDWNLITWGAMSGKECVIDNPFSLFIPRRAFTVRSINNSKSVHDDVRGIQIIEQTVKFLPKGIDRFFPNLTMLWILYSKLQAIEESDLKPFPALTELVLRGNEIETVDDDLFKSNSALVLVDLGANKIKTIGSRILVPLSELIKVYFNQNVCIDKEASNEDEMIELVEDYKANCSIVKVEKSTEAIKLEVMITTTNKYRTTDEIIETTTRKRITEQEHETTLHRETTEFQQMIMEDNETTEKMFEKTTDQTYEETTQLSIEHELDVVSDTNISDEMYYDTSKEQADMTTDETTETTEFSDDDFTKSTKAFMSLSELTTEAKMEMADVELDKITERQIEDTFYNSMDNSDEIAEAKDEVFRKIEEGKELCQNQKNCRVMQRKDGSIFI